jgi:hypothetical protein
MATTALDDAVRIGVKLYARDPERVDPALFIPLFHGWIQHNAIDGLPIDVADYAHVHEGPGVMLIGHEADHAIDLGEGRPGILYQRKREPEGTLEERVEAALAAADRAAEQIEADPAAGGVEFGRDEILVRVLDRRAAPNDEATAAELLPAVEAAVAAARPGRTATIERVDDPAGPLALRIRLS